MLFISLAFDSREQLKAFLSKTKFDYAVVPVQEQYLMDTMGVNEFPTQFIINKKGRIVKVVTDYHDMVSVLKRELLKKIISLNINTLAQNSTAVCFLVSALC